MVTLKSAWVTVVLAAFSLFIISNLLTIYSGLAPLPAFIENVLGSLQVDYYIFNPGMQNNPYVLASDFINSIVFVLITVVLASWFFEFIANLSIRRGIVLSRISKAKNHVIVAPFTQLAKELMLEFKKAGIKAVFITEDKEDLADLYAKNEMVLVGSLKSMKVFESAGIKRAKYVVACSEDDLQNTLIAITAKNANPNIKVISRVRDESDIPKLSIAGAYWMVKPEIAAGAKVADELIKRLV